MNTRLRSSTQSVDRARLTLSVRDQGLNQQLVQAIEALQRAAVAALDAQSATDTAASTQAGVIARELVNGVWDTGKATADQFTRSGTGATIGTTTVADGRYIGTPGGGIARYEVPTGVIAQAGAQAALGYLVHAWPLTSIVSPDSVTAGEFELAWQIGARAHLALPKYKTGAAPDAGTDTLGRTGGMAEVVLLVDLSLRTIDASITSVALQTMGYSVYALERST